jgi:1,2-diacylglycerol 3-alpha-glucosyltransferase
VFSLKADVELSVNMKILMLCDFFHEDQQYQENLLVKYFRRAGHDVVVLSSTYESIFEFISEKKPSHTERKEFKIDGATIIRLPYSINILNKLRKLKGAKTIINSTKPDLIYAHDIHLNMADAISYLRENPSARMIMDYHADYSNSGKNWISISILHKIIRKSFLKLHLKYISKIYPVVPASFKFLEEVYGIEKERMELIPLGCDYELAEKIRKQNNKKSIREELGLVPKDFMVFTAGKFHPQKKTELLIEAFKRMHDKNIVLVIAGNALSEFEWYETKLKALATNCKVIFVGWASSVRILELMNAAQLAVFPASQSVMWQSAIGMHLPLILGDTGNQDASYLNYDQNVINLTKDQINAETLEENILRIYENKELHARMQSGAKNTAELFLDYSKICEKILNIFNQHPK